MNNIVNFIRTIYRELKWIARYIVLSLYWLSIRIKGESVVIYMCTPEHGNLGDQAIAQATYSFLMDCYPDTKILEIPARLLRREWHIRLFGLIIGQNRILIHGGGYIGTLWPNEDLLLQRIIRIYSDNQIVIMPQTLFFDMTKEGEQVLEQVKRIYGSHKDLWLCTREQYSYDFAVKHLQGVHTHLVPDMVPYYRYEGAVSNRDGIVLCLRNDKEAVMNNENKEHIRSIVGNKLPGVEIKDADTVLPRWINRRERKLILDEFLDIFASSKVIITDRLHGMVFAAITNTPCITLDSKSHKVKGVYKWLSKNEFIRYTQDVGDVAGLLDELYDIKTCHFDDSLLISGYDELKKILQC